MTNQHKPLWHKTAFRPARFCALRRGMLPLLALLFLLPAAFQSSTAIGWAAAPQALSQDSIEVGFLFNFTRFVEWPESLFPTPTSPFILCIVDTSDVVDMLNVVSSGKVVNGRTVLIRHMKAMDDFHACHVLFISMEEERHAGRILNSVKGAGVLTVGESPSFTQAGGVLNFAVQDNKVKLELNLDAAKRAGLKMSAKLIAVSHLVSDNSSAGGI